jgi:hypothetical protein
MTAIAASAPSATLTHASVKFFIHLCMVFPVPHNLLPRLATARHAKLVPVVPTTGIHTLPGSRAAQRPLRLGAHGCPAMQAACRSAHPPASQFAIQRTFPHKGQTRAEQLVPRPPLHHLVMLAGRAPAPAALPARPLCNSGTQASMRRCLHGPAHAGSAFPAAGLCGFASHCPRPA